MNRSPIDHGSSSFFQVLGVKVNAIQIPQVITQIENWIEKAKRCHFVAVTGMHGVTEAQHDSDFKNILNAADLVVPDGMPLVWVGRLRGYGIKRRVYGPELMETFCQKTGQKYRHFFYGGAPGVPKQLAQTLEENYQIRTVGTYSPPFRPLTAEEDTEIVDIINQANPDVLWVGLSTPKQEKWMYEHRDKLKVSVMLGVGAAFDLNIGRVKQAPKWMREHGLEWLFRLMMEPRRLWHRYLVYGSKFAFLVSLDLLGLKKFD